MTEREVADMIGKAMSQVLGGMQIALVHFGTVLEQRNVITKDELAGTFDRTANVLPPNLEGRDLQAKILRGIAEGLRTSGIAGPRAV